MKKPATEMTEAERLLVLAGQCLNQVPDHPVALQRDAGIQRTYDMAARIDAYLRRRFGKNAHEI